MAPLTIVIQGALLVAVQAQPAADAVARASCSPPDAGTICEPGLSENEHAGAGFGPGAPGGFVPAPAWLTRTMAVPMVRVADLADVLEFPSATISSGPLPVLL